MICLLALTVISRTREPVILHVNWIRPWEGFDAPEQSDGAVDDLNDVLTGFSDTGVQDTVAATGKRWNQGLDWLDLFGSFTLGMSWNLAHHAPEPGSPDYRGLSMLRLTGDLGADVDLGSWKLRVSGHAWYDGAWSVNGERSAYTGAFLNAYESELEADEVYLSGSLARNLDIKIGRQVVVWGKADNVRVTDVLNPLDNRVPGMTDIKYRRLPVTMSRADLYLGPWRPSTRDLGWIPLEGRRFLAKILGVINRGIFFPLFKGLRPAKEGGLP